VDIHTLQNVHVKYKLLLSSQKQMQWHAEVYRTDLLGKHFTQLEFVELAG